MNPVRNLPSTTANMDNPSPPSPHSSVHTSSFDGNADIIYSLHQSYNGDLESPNDMMVDSDDFVTEQAENEKNDVAIINPDQLGSDVEMADKPRADDCAYIL
jgi:hypothetical protein